MTVPARMNRIVDSARLDSNFVSVEVRLAPWDQSGYSEYVPQPANPAQEHDV